MLGALGAARGARADEPQPRPRGQLRALPGGAQDVEALLGRGPSDPQRREGLGGRRRDGGRPERVVDRLGGQRDAPGPERAGVRGDVGPVGDDDGRAPVRGAQQRAGEQVRRGAQMAPERAPQDEGHAAAPRAGQRGGQRDAPRRAAHHGPVGARRGQAADGALGDVAVGHAGVGDRPGGVVRAPAEQRQLDREALVQGAEGPGAIGRDQVRDEQDGARVAQRRASS